MSTKTRLVTVELLQQMRVWRLKEIEELDKVILDETLSRPPLDEVADAVAQAVDKWLSNWDDCRSMSDVVVSAIVSASPNPEEQK